MLARVNQGRLEEAARSGGGGGKDNDDDLSGVYRSDEARRDMAELDAYMDVSRKGEGWGSTSLFVCVCVLYCDALCYVQKVFFHPPPSLSLPRLRMKAMKVNWVFKKLMRKKIQSSGSDLTLTTSSEGVSFSISMPIVGTIANKIEYVKTFIYTLATTTHPPNPCTNPMHQLAATTSHFHQPCPLNTNPAHHPPPLPSYHLHPPPPPTTPSYGLTKVVGVGMFSREITAYKNDDGSTTVEIRNPAKPHKPWTRRTFRRGTGPGELDSISECVLDGEVLAVHSVVNVPV